MMTLNNNTTGIKVEGTKVDKRKKYIMVLDVETAGNIGKPLVYDLGFAVIDKKGNIYEEKSFVISEIFDNQKLMEGAYYSNKLPLYYEGLENGKYQKVSFMKAREEFLKLMYKYDISTISAYNLNFDMRALKTTMEKFNGKGMKFLTADFKDIDLLCIWSFACEVLYSRKSFINFIDKHNYMTPKGNPLTNAEVGYQYITGNTDFEEAHMGLDDVRIEAKILAKCIAQKKRHDSGILGSPWNIVAKYNKSVKEK